MAIQKRLKKIWNGIAWVEIYHPTSTDLVNHKGVPLEGVIDELRGDIDTHSVDADLHKTTGDKTKLGNLPNDANGTFATKTEVETHAADEGLHKTEDEKKVLDDLTSLLPDVPSDTFATKQELAEAVTSLALIPMAVADILLRDDLVDPPNELPAGQQVWVTDPSEDTDNIDGPGAALYIWNGSDWLFVTQMSNDISVDWSDVANRPVATASQIDAAVNKAHAHGKTVESTFESNLDVLNELGEDESGDLTYKGNPIGIVYSKIYLQDEEPDNPNVNDMWLAPIEEEEIDP